MLRALCVCLALAAGPAPGAGGSVQEATGASSRIFRGPFSPADLVSREVTGEVGYALALGLLMQGRFEQGGEAMARLVEAEESPLHERFVREAARIRAYREERRSFLRHLQDTGRKLNLRKTEWKLLAPIEEVRENDVVLGKNRANIDVLTLDDVDAVAFSDAMYSSDFETSAISAYPSVLAGEVRRKRLSGDTDVARSLLADLNSGFEGHAERAQAARRLVFLSRVELPVGAGDVGSTLEAIGQLVKDYGKLDLVRERRGLLRRLAAETLKARFEREGLMAVLKGETVPLGNGVVRISYGFNNPEELLDFTQVGYLDEHAFLPKKEFAIQDSKLRGSGFLSMRHILDFHGALTVRTTWRYRTTAGWKYLFWLGLNDNDRGSFVAAKLDGGLIVVNREKGEVEDVAGDFTWNFDEAHTLEVYYDGRDRALASMDGKAMKKIGVGSRKSGGVFLMSCSKMELEIEEFVIEGSLDDATLTKLRDSWTAARLVGLGLGG